MRFLTDEKVMV